MYHTKVIPVEVVQAGGTSLGSVGVPPCRFAGSFYTCEPDGDFGVVLTNKDQTLQTLTNVDDGDMRPLAWDAELLCSGEINVAVSGASADGIVYVSCLIRY
jgi:hypothetical protein